MRFRSKVISINDIEAQAGKTRSGDARLRTRKLKQGSEVLDFSAEFASNSAINSKSTSFMPDLRRLRMYKLALQIEGADGI
jgi:hypothetical protein